MRLNERCGVPELLALANNAEVADLIAGGMLVDVKAGQGGNPRKDGTRAAHLGRDELDQLIGYTLMDYFDTFKLHTLRPGVVHLLEHVATARAQARAECATSREFR